MQVLINSQLELPETRKPIIGSYGVLLMMKIEDHESLFN